MRKALASPFSKLWTHISKNTVCSVLLINKSIFFPIEPVLSNILRLFFVAWIKIPEKLWIARAQDFEQCFLVRVFKVSLRLLSVEDVSSIRSPNTRYSPLKFKHNICQKYPKPLVKCKI
jgi:hypothetical protein